MTTRDELREAWKAGFLAYKSDESGNYHVNDDIIDQWAADYAALASDPAPALDVETLAAALREAFLSGYRDGVAWDDRAAFVIREYARLTPSPQPTEIE